MPAKRNILTLRLRRLAAQLAQMRDTAGLSKEEVSRRTGINETTLYRIETARVRPQRRTLVALLDLYTIDEPQRGEALQLFADAATPGMSRLYQLDVAEEYSAYINFEAEALSVRNFELQFVPGLLQTERYALAVIDSAMPRSEASAVEQRVRARIDRQALLMRQEPLELWVVMDEAAVCRVVGNIGIMREQLTHLVSMSKLNNVTLQVIPFDAGAHAGMHGAFSVVDFPDPADPELVYIEGMAGQELLEGEVVVRRYGLLFDHLRAMALSPRQTMSLLQQAADRMI